MTTHGMTYHTTSVTGGYSVEKWKAANREERELAQEVLFLKKNAEANAFNHPTKNKKKTQHFSKMQTFVFEI